MGAEFVVQGLVGSGVLLTLSTMPLKQISMQLSWGLRYSKVDRSKSFDYDCGCYCEAGGIVSCALMTSEG